MTSSARSAYEAYVELRRLSWPGAIADDPHEGVGAVTYGVLTWGTEPARALAEMEAMGRQSARAKTSALWSRGLDRFRSEHLAEADGLHSEIRRVFASENLVGAFEAALYIIGSMPWHPIGELDPEGLARMPDLAEPTSFSLTTEAAERLRMEDVRIFRGQRDASWGLEPPMFREPEVSGDATLSDRLKDLGNLLPHLRTLFPTASVEELAAVAQHYAAEARVKTWLVDVTLDPFVALFFASLAGEEGKRGRVFRISSKHFREMGAGPGTILGDPIVHFVPGVARLERQRGAFISGGSAAALDAYVPWTIAFEHTSEAFVDADRGITETDLLATDKAIVAAIDTYHRTQPVETMAVELEPFVQYERGLGQNELFAWAVARHAPARTLPPATRRALDQLCAFHARLMKETDIPVFAKSLNRLDSAAHDLLEPVRRPPPTLHQLVTRNYDPQLSVRGPDREALWRVARSISEGVGTEGS